MRIIQAKELGASLSYLSQVQSGKSPASPKVISKHIAGGVASCYNFGRLGNSLTVGQRTLNPSVKVRILLPQPITTSLG